MSPITFTWGSEQVEIQSSYSASTFLFLLSQPQPTCLAVVCVCEQSPNLGLQPAEDKDPAGGPGCAAWDVVYLDFDHDPTMVAGCEKARAALLWPLASSSSALQTHYWLQRSGFFPDLRSISPTGEFLPAAYVLWHAILWWLDIFPSRPALKQQNRQGNKPWPLSGAALFWFDFFSFFCKLWKLLWVYRTLFSITPTGFQTVISFSKHSIESYGVVGIATFHPFPFLLHWPQIHFIWLPATLSFCCLLPSLKWNQSVIFFYYYYFFATVITL